MKDTSQEGTYVKYGKRGHQRQDFTWILDIYKYDLSESKDVKAKVGDLKFKIEIPNHKDCSEYKNNVDDFLRKGHQSVQTLNTLGIDTIKETEITAQAFSKADKTSNCPIYLQIEMIGAGAFGKVWLIKNVSTGESYACKKFFQSVLEREAWLKAVKNEIQIMHDYKHVSVAPILIKLELTIWKKHVMPVEGDFGETIRG